MPTCKKRLGKKTGKELSALVINMYANVVENFVKVDIVEGLKQDRKNLICMTDLGILVYRTFGEISRSEVFQRLVTSITGKENKSEQPFLTSCH